MYVTVLGSREKVIPVKGERCQHQHLARQGLRLVPRCEPQIYLQTQPLP